MDEKMLKKWREYKEWVKKQNKPMLDIWLKIEEKAWKEYERERLDYEEKKKAYDKELQQEFKNYEDWTRLPFYKRWFIPEPQILDPFRRPPRYPILPVTFPYIPPIRESWEGFLDWLSS